MFCEWELEFEQLYYQSREDHLHFIHPCVHQVLHLVTETIQKGPPVCYAQWTMEQTIGNIGQEIQQPSNPYANFAQEGVCRCQVNALLSIMPELHNPPKPLPNGAVDIGDGYALLRKRDRKDRPPDAEHVPAIRNFLGEDCPIPRILRWARTQLPNGQIIHSRWREDSRALHRLCISCNIKVSVFIKIALCVWTYIIYSLHAMAKIALVKYNMSHDFPLQLARWFGGLPMLRFSIYILHLTRTYFQSHHTWSHHVLY